VVAALAAGGMKTGLFTQASSLFIQVIIHAACSITLIERPDAPSLTHHGGGEPP
jgi:hypothetical protein